MSGENSKTWLPTSKPNIPGLKFQIRGRSWTLDWILVVGICLGFGLWNLGFGPAGLPVAAAEQKLTYVDLVNRLTDLEYVATIPPEGENCGQWSSYDRAS